MRGQVVPEGMHQDGFDYIALGCLGSVNVKKDWRTYVFAGGPTGASRTWRRRSHSSATTSDRGR